MEPPQSQHLCTHMGLGHRCIQSFSIFWVLNLMFATPMVYNTTSWELLLWLLRLEQWAWNFYIICSISFSEVPVLLTISWPLECLATRTSVVLPSLAWSSCIGLPTPSSVFLLGTLSSISWSWMWNQEDLKLQLGRGKSCTHYTWV